MINKSNCAGCRNDFYNYGNHGLDGDSVGCWSRETAKIIVRFRIHRDTRPTEKGAFTKVRKPDCYHATGYSFCNTLPAFVKSSDLNRARRSA